MGSPVQARTSRDVERDEEARARSTAPVASRGSVPSRGARPVRASAVRASAASRACRPAPPSAPACGPERAGLTGAVAPGVGRLVLGREVDAGLATRASRTCASRVRRGREVAAEVAEDRPDGVAAGVRRGEHLDVHAVRPTWARTVTGPSASGVDVDGDDVLPGARRGEREERAGELLGQRGRLRGGRRRGRGRGGAVAEAADVATVPGTASTIGSTGRWRSRGPSGGAVDRLSSWSEGSREPACAVGRRDGGGRRRTAVRRRRRGGGGVGIADPGRTGSPVTGGASERPADPVAYRSERPAGRVGRRAGRARAGGRGCSCGRRRR